jgi:hypothetical protein
MQAIGPELSSIMDKLLGGPGWVDADRAEDSPLPLSEVRRRLSLLRPEEREQVPVVRGEGTVACVLCVYVSVCVFVSMCLSVCVFVSMCVCVSYVCVLLGKR